jgi:hypothetical protein
MLLLNFKNAVAATAVLSLFVIPGLDPGPLPSHPRPDPGIQVVCLQPIIT